MYARLQVDLDLFFCNINNFATVLNGGEEALEKRVERGWDPRSYFGTRGREKGKVGVTLKRQETGRRIQEYRGGIDSMRKRRGKKINSVGKEGRLR